MGKIIQGPWSSLGPSPRAIAKNAGSIPKTIADLRFLGYEVITYDRREGFDEFWRCGVVHCCSILRLGRRFFWYHFSTQPYCESDMIDPMKVYSAHSLYKSYGPRSGRITPHDEAFPNYDQYKWRPGKPRDLEEIPQEYFTNLQGEPIEALSARPI